MANKSQEQEKISTISKKRDSGVKWLGEIPEGKKQHISEKNFEVGHVVKIL